MPKKSKKSKSKRKTLKQKYKIVKKVKEHHKKKAKELRKSGGKKVKDPGIPAAWPFKEQLIKDLQAKQAHVLAQDKAKKEERKRQRELAAAGGGDDAMGEEHAMEALQADAAAKLAQYEGGAKKRRRAEEAGTATDNDGSRRAFYREFVRVVEAADVIIQVLDARDPLGTRCPEVERFIRGAGPDKRIVLLLNKIDLVPREVAEQWLKYLRQELPTIAFKCSTQRQAARLSQRAMPSAGAGDDALTGSECLGAEQLLQLLKNYARNAKLKTSIAVGIVGLPNVGKSSLINSLKRTRVAAVGNAPGVTKSVQQVHLDKHVKLLDSPGIVFDAAEGDAGGAALRNAVRVERLEDPVAPVAEIVARCPARQLMSAYKVPAFKGAEEFLQHVAVARGKLKKGGSVDLLSAARQVLTDWNEGRLKYYTLPPKRGSNAVAGEDAVVASWGQEFDADAVYGGEGARAVVEGLPSLDDSGGGGGGGFVQADSRGPAAVDLEGMMREDAEEEEEDGAEEEEEEGMSGSDLEEEEGEQEDGPGAMDEGDGRRQAAAKAPSKAVPQTIKLYGEEGQYNPHAARADRKRQKRAKQRSDGIDYSRDDDEGSDYEFDGATWGEEEGANIFAKLPADGDEGGEEGGAGEAAMSGSDVE